MKIKLGKLWAGCSRGRNLGSCRVTDCKTGRAQAGHRFTVDGPSGYPKTSLPRREPPLTGVDALGDSFLLTKVPGHLL